MSILIRMATVEDAQQLLDIYGPYVRHTAISFEYEVPTVEEFRNRITRTLSKYPYLVAIEDEEIIGYAYASTFKERIAYERAVETTVYVKQGHHGRGVGRRLYAALEVLLKRQNILNMNACIAHARTEDEALTNESEEFHQRLGFRQVGHFTQCGYKFGRWYDIVWMEKLIGEHTDQPKPVIPIGDLE